METRTTDRDFFGGVQSKTTAQASGERYFRLYRKHAVAPDMDTLFNFLNAMHSLNDRLRKATGRSFLDIEEFVALKALRNLFHHHEELLYEVKTFQAQDLPPISTDLLFLCLTPAALVQVALAQVQPKHREYAAVAMSRTFRRYGEIVNINPCLFNLSVRIYERLKETSIELDDEAYVEFDASYRMEEEAGHSHIVTGHIHCHASSVDEILERVFRRPRS